MAQNDLITLAQLLSGHTGRSLTTISSWCGEHKRLFPRLADGHGCNLATYQRALTALSQIWPADLEWPRDIARPASTSKGRAA